MYAWMITADVIDGDEPDYDATGTLVQVGGMEESHPLRARIEAEHPKAETFGKAATIPVPDGMERKRFRMYDDDGELYYRGVIIMDADASGFEPLDWAMPNAGCTEIRYLDDGSWNTL